MKTSMRWMGIIAGLLLSLSSGASANSEKSVTINPQTLRTLLLSQNIDIAVALNQVQQAKTHVSQARASLLPSVNLGSVISSGPSFMLTSVSFLMPFLMPSKWMDLKESTHLLKAQGISYYLAQINGYASAYSLYMTVLGDMELRNALYRQYENFKAIEDQLRLPAEVGIIRKEDFLQAQAQAELALVQVSQVDELIVRETAAIRQMLGLSLNQKIIFAPATTAASNYEGWKPQALLDKVHASSPETQQMDSLLLAAEYAKWSKTFGFLSGASLGVNRPVTGGSFSSVTSNSSVDFGFGYFPALELSNQNLAQLRLRKQEVRLEQAQLIEATLGAMTEAHKQYNSAVQAEENLRTVYDAEYMRYQVGIVDIVQVLQAGNSLTTAVVNKVKAQTNLNTLRVSLHRMTGDDQFKAIEKCVIERRSSGGIKGRLGRIFNPGKDRVTIDDVCR